MKVESRTSWDESFFNSFFTFRNEIHKDIVTSFPENLEDYAKYFTPQSVFTKDFSWEAFMVKADDRIVAKAILCWRRGTNKGNLGFLDWIDDFEVAKLLIEAVNKCGKNNFLQSLKTPVDLNFFVKYRIRTPGGGKPFWGEPIYPDYYHELFQKTGFSVIGHWDTYEINKFQNILDFFNKRKKLANKQKNHPSEVMRTNIRCIKMDDWNNELRIIYELFYEAYKNMSEWEPISFEQFRIIYDDFKYIINPLYAYIVELRGRPVGFSINFADPLTILLKVKGKKLTLLEKALLMAKLRINRSCLLIAHIGKISGPDGEEIKGIQIQVSKRIQLLVAMMRKTLVTFQMTNSPSRRSFEETSQKPYSQYVLYGKSIL